MQPHWRHLAALLELAEDPGLAHLFTDWTVGEETRGETPTWERIPPLWKPGRNLATRGSG